ncbi:MAG TPA: chain length determinant protein tyrosine kinase EpsG [Burkholderiales bacterium]|nr:chain length determinant protein tyrosine kinase EpsG [Burkholderiales bacterium]
MAESNVILTAALRSPVLRDQRSIGAVLVDAGRLKIQDAEAILRLQREKNLRFGDAAIQLGLLTQADIDYALSLQFQYPFLSPGQSAVSEEIMAAYAPSHPRIEALRTLRSQLILRWFDTGPENRALAIVSAERGEGRSFIAANLAVVFAQLGERTLLVDADLRNPRQHTLFGVDGRTGLSTVLAERAGLEAVQSVPALPNLSIFPAGPVAPNPVELLARPLLPQLLQQLAQKFDVILLDSSASTGTSDAQIVAVRAGAALIVVRRNAARSWRVHGVSTQVAEARATIVGAVLNSY